MFNDLRSLGAPEWFIRHEQNITAHDHYFLVDLLRPLVLAYGHAMAVNKRLANKLLQQERELKARGERIAALTKEKLDWEDTNRRKNKYFQDYIQKVEDANALLKGALADLKKEHQDLKNATFVERYSSAGVATGRTSCQQPNQASEPCISYKDKTSWEVGDVVFVPEEGWRGEVIEVLYDATRSPWQAEVSKRGDVSRPGQTEVRYFAKAPAHWILQEAFAVRRAP